MLLIRSVDPIDVDKDNIPVDSQNVNAMQEDGHPIAPTPKVWSIVADELIRFVDAAHPMVVVVDHLGYPDISSRIVAPHILNMSLVRCCSARLPSLSFNALCVGTSVNRCHHLHHVVINPSPYEKVALVVDQLE